jgi:hypothetical protein
VCVCVCVCAAGEGGEGGGGGAAVATKLVKLLKVGRVCGGEGVGDGRVGVASCRFR